VIARIAVVWGILAASAAGMGWLARPEARAAREPLRQLPYTVDRYQGSDAKEFDAKTLAVLGVDDYITRLYAAPDEAAMSLYIGYYDSQRTGDTMHSPMRCLPGTGWQPLSTSVQPLEVNDSGQRRTIEVNRYLVQKGLQRHVVLFWYQMHGRVIPSEYSTKWFLIRDAVALNRTDGALVRIIAPVPDRGGEAAADASAAGFVRALFPRLSTYLPN
jgi:EpsI family protein